jgi:hypothetical protein
VSEVVDLAKRRYDAANDCAEVTPLQALKELVRQIENDEFNPASIMVISLVEENDGNFVLVENAGPATTNERLGMNIRAQTALQGLVKA